MRSSILHATVQHTRSEPVEHSFDFPLLSFVFDLDELVALDSGLSGFSYNGRNLFSLWDADYLTTWKGNLRQRLEGAIVDRGISEKFTRMELVTTARLLGYVFNPVNFYLCYRADGSVGVFAAEVNNTFGETHLYLVSVSSPGPDSPSVLQFRHEKAFFVSPFFDVSGDYHFSLGLDPNRVDIGVKLLRGGKQKNLSFLARLSGDRVPLTTGSLWKHFLRWPMLAWLTVPRILWHAARLYYQKKLPMIAKPLPLSPDTISFARPGFIDRIYLGIVDRLLRRTARGGLQLQLPNGELRFYGEHLGRQAFLQAKNYSFFRNLVLSGDVGFGESYVDEACDSPDIGNVIAFVAENYAELDDRQILLSRLGRLMNRVIHLRRPNSRRNSKSNISAHYDLGNEFFREFLDPSMTYSCATFRSPSDTLEQAQLSKVRGLIDKAKIERGHQVLEIGCGWGTFAIEAAKRTGCRVSCLTLSEEQYKFTQARVAAAKLKSQISVELCDYREFASRPERRAKFDRIVSIEMLEAVGDEHLGEFFSSCDKLLKPEGLMLLQFISMPDQRYGDYVRSCDWIQKYIFPGGVCPSLTSVCNAATAKSSFVVENLENIGPQYARTLWEWRKAFQENFHRLEPLGFDERFRRMWTYYLGYCEAGFATRTLGTLQMLLTRPNNPTLFALPETNEATEGRQARFKIRG